MRKINRILFAIIALLVVPLPLLGQEGAIPDPDQHFGFDVGGDRNLVDWSQITEYFEAVAAASPRVQIVELGKSTNGRTMIAAYISSQENIEALPSLLARQHELTYLPRQEDEEGLVSGHKLVMMINCSIHSTEIGASQMSLELLHRLATQEDEETRAIRDRVVVVLVPSPNPDGIDMVVEWYRRWLGTPYEGSYQPWLYQEYAGHDNNRDWYMLNLPETRVVTGWLYGKWFPLIVWDAHQMGSRGQRAIMPPHADPPNPFIHPLVLESLAACGHAMKLEAIRDGNRGMAHGMWFSVWWNGGFRTTPYFKNSIGLLTELASAKLATPIEITKEELGMQMRGAGPLDKTVQNPAPWTGGRWGLPEIVKMEHSFARGLLVHASRNYMDIIRNYRRMCLDTREAADGGPAGYLMPRRQRDMGALRRVVEIMQAHGIEVSELKKDLAVAGAEYPAGTLVFSGYQPYRPFIRSLFDRVNYPAWNMDPEGNPRGPYDLSGWTLSDQFGLHMVSVNAEDWQSSGIGELLGDAGPINGHPVTTSTGATIYPAGDSDTILAINALLKNNEMVTREDVQDETGAQDQAYVHYNPQRDASGYDISGKIAETAERSMHLPNLALLRGYLASMDEGWTRYLLDNFDFPYESVDGARIKAGALFPEFGAIILPSVRGNQLIEGQRAEDYPPEFVGGIGEEGVAALDEFVRGGGTLICITSSCSTMIEKLGLPVVDVIKDVPRTEFSIPGSLLRLEPDLRHPLCFGLDKEVAAMFRGGLAFEAVEGRESEVEIAARWAEEDLLVSGFAHGGEKIAGKGAVALVRHGEGRVVLVGFPCQFRAQPYATFKLLFNAIYLAGDHTPGLPKLISRGGE